MRFLLDVNVLVALALPEHSGHPRAHRWSHHEPSRPWASCPQTQSGFLRVACRLMGGSKESLRFLYNALSENCRESNHEFWPYTINLADVGETFLSRLQGPNQITDLQLLLLAHRHHGQLVTLDRGILELARGTRYANSVTVL